MHTEWLLQVKFCNWCCLLQHALLPLLQQQLKSLDMQWLISNRTTTTTSTTTTTNTALLSLSKCLNVQFYILKSVVCLPCGINIIALWKCENVPCVFGYVCGTQKEVTKERKMPESKLLLPLLQTNALYMCLFQILLPGFSNFIHMPHLKLPASWPL